MHDDPRTFIYWIGSDDTIVQVNAAWLAFAMENGSDCLSTESVVGKSLWTFIASDVVRHLYQMVFHRIRHGQSIQGIPYRCDAPDSRRFMQMDLKPAAGLSVQIENRIIRQESRVPVPILSDYRDMSDQILLICSFCKRIKTGPSCWAEVEEAMATLGLNDAWPLPQLSHGVCEKCFAHWETLGEQE